MTTSDWILAALALATGAAMVWVASRRRPAPPSERNDPLGWNAAAELAQAVSPASRHEPPLVV